MTKKQFEFRTYLSKDKRPFRLSGIKNEEGNYMATIKWLDTKKFQTFNLSVIEPYLK